MPAKLPNTRQGLDDYRPILTVVTECPLCKNYSFWYTTDGQPPEDTEPQCKGCKAKLEYWTVVDRDKVEKGRWIS